MEFMWLYSLCECMVSVCVIVLSVRLCMAVAGGGGSGSSASASVSAADVQGRGGGRGPHAVPAQQHLPGSVSCCLRLCLGWVGAVGGAVGVPVSVFLNLRTPQCLYPCITLVCCPLLVRQFTMFLLMLLTLDAHLQHTMAERYSSVMTRQRAVCVVLLCWIGSVLSSFAQFIGGDVLSTWRSASGQGVGLDGNWTSSSSSSSPPPPPPPQYHHQDRKVIGRYLPYGGFLSKFYVEDMHNFTYAQIHSSHWGVCAPDTVLSPRFLVYVHGVTAFVLPSLCLLAVYLDTLLRLKPRETPFAHVDPPKQDPSRVRSLALSLSLLVVLCLPLHIIHALLLFTPSTFLPSWAHAVATLLFHLYSLVPQILFTPPPKARPGEGLSGSFPLSVPRHLPATAVVVPSRGKSVRLALCEAMQAAPWASAKHSLKAKVCPEV